MDCKTILTYLGQRNFFKRIVRKNEKRSSRLQCCQKHTTSWTMKIETLNSSRFENSIEQEIPRATYTYLANQVKLILDRSTNRHIKSVEK